MNKHRLPMSLLLWVAFIAMGRGQTLIDLRTQAKSVDFSAAGSTKPMKAGSSLPGTCGVGEFFFLTSAPAGSNIYACNPANVWTLEGNTLSVDSSTTNKVVSSSGSSLQWVALGGDISGPPNSVTVNRLQGRPLSGAAPGDGQVLKWSAARNDWEPAASQAGNSAYAFASQVAITIPGSTHPFGTANLIVDCYDGGTPPKHVEPDSIQINQTTYDVAITFSAPQTGYCVVNGAGSAGGSGTGGGSTTLGGDLAGNTSLATVTGIQNRTVANTAPSNGQVLVWNAAGSAWQPGALGSSQLPSAGGDLSGGLTAATVTGLQNRAVASTAPADGQALVWNAASSTWKPATVSGSGAVATVFGRSGSVTAQTGDYSFSQISGTVGANQLPGAAGDLSGALTAATVTGIQNRAVSNTAPADGQALVWSATTSKWQPSSVAGSGGASMTSQLGDLAAVRSSPTVLTIGANCTSAAPCNVRFGYQVFNISNSATATISGSGTGTAYVYVNNSGSLVVGHNLTVACSAGCIQQAGVTSFPANVIPIYSWTATNGSWDTAGGRDQRAFLSAKPISGGAGIIATEAPGQTTVAVDTGVIPTYLTNSAILNFPNIPASACSPDLTLNVTGANTGDAIAPGWPAGLPSGLLGLMVVSTSNTVSVRLCNLSGSALQPPSASYRATIVRNY